MKSVFAERLKYLREEKGLSQRELSKELGGKITAPAISFWEQDKREPGLSSAKILAEYFGVSIDYLAGLEEKNF